MKNKTIAHIINDGDTLYMLFTDNTYATFKVFTTGRFNNSEDKEGEGVLRYLGEIYHIAAHDFILCDEEEFESGSEG